MNKYEVRACAVEWCGYETIFEIEAEHEDEAEEKACQMLIEEYDLMLYEYGEYGESEDFDDDGEPLEEDSLTTIMASAVLL